jgi:diguanylate cyclase (GGDEF)-like protein
MSSLHLPIREGQDRADVRKPGTAFTMNASIFTIAVVRKAVLLLTAIPAFAAASGAAPSSPPNTLHAISALTNDEARQAIPVEFEATVGYSRGYENLLFVQDGTDAIFVRPPTGMQLATGDRILIQGTTRASFRPLIVGSHLTLLRHGAPPKSLPATFDQLIRAQDDSLTVTVHAVVRAVDLVVAGGGNAPVVSSRLQLVTEGGHLEANLDNHDPDALKGLLDAEVEITGAAAGKFDDKMQQTGIVLYVPSLSSIHVLKRSSAGPWSLPVTPMDQILAVYHENDLTPRVRVHGTITYYQPGSAIVLQDGPKSMWIAVHTHEPLQIGDLADATGFPESHERLLTLSDGEVLDSHIFQPITPQAATWHQLGYWSSNSPDGHMYDLVSIEGKVVTEIREASQDEYVLATGDRLFTAIYRHPPASAAIPIMRDIPLGSTVRVAGICVIVDANTVNPGEEVPFNILLRNFDDIAVLANPSLLTVRNLGIVVGMLLFVLLAVGTRAWFVEHRARQHTATSAYIERRRGRILEDINGSRPLTEIIEQITELVSFRLKGAPCWVQISGGARLGNCPKVLSRMRVVRHEIPARTGAALGEVFAAFDPLTKPHDIESESLAAAVGLAALAIETRRLYTDLIRRSEFDLLTDIHNRFSLDKRMDAQIEEAYQDGGIFGLIYIDLDNFKRVNDQLGHRIGDLYLQEMALRMKRQLRSVDTLARLGGDEFAILVPLVRSHADVKEIALRLERCFDAPLTIQGVTLHPAASVGVALYPEDATTKDGLLSAADDSMYKTKNAKRRLAHTLGVGEVLESEFGVRS